MAKGLGRHLAAAIRYGKLKGLSLHQIKLPLSHKQFVYDNMIMRTPTVREAQIIKRVLTEFMEASGTYINESKSQFFFFNTPLHIQSNIACNLGFQHNPLLFKYLDIPLIENSL
jgi:hypothetical protein